MDVRKTPVCLGMPMPSDYLGVRQVIVQT